MKYYHGTTKENYNDILKHGFKKEKIGQGWGSTYGKGFYFTPHYDMATSYADSDEYIICIEISENTNLFPLPKRYSPMNHHHKRELQKIKQQLAETCDGYKTIDNEEIILFENKHITVVLS